MTDLIRDHDGLVELMMYVADRDNITPGSMAKHLGVSPYRISLFFSGGDRRALTQDHILKLADMMGIEIKVAVGLK